MGSPSPSASPLSFVRVEEQLDEERFLRISRGFIVQMDAILRLDGDVCLLKDGTSALISRRERKEIAAATTTTCSRSHKPPPEKRRAYYDAAAVPR